jgi:hypothetical protein
MRHRFFRMAMLTAGAIASCVAQESIPSTPLVIPSSAIKVERSQTGSWYSEGCSVVKFSMQAAYPAKDALDFISRRLSAEGLNRAVQVERRFLPTLLSHSFNHWEGFTNIDGYKSYKRTDQWRDKAGALASYFFSYDTPDRSTLKVEAEFCPAPVVQKYRCTPDKPRPSSPPTPSFRANHEY